MEVFSQGCVIVYSHIPGIIQVVLTRRRVNQSATRRSYKRVHDLSGWGQLDAKLQLGAGRWVEDAEEEKAPFLKTVIQDANH